MKKKILGLFMDLIAVYCAAFLCLYIWNNFEMKFWNPPTINLAEAFMLSFAAMVLVKYYEKIRLTTKNNNKKQHD